MPLYLTWECCKCHLRGCKLLWAIGRNHKYNYTRPFCYHFNIRIDSVSSKGFFGLGWNNEIALEVENKGSTKKEINKLFNGECTEYEDFVQFDNLVFHARVSDYQGKLPTCGYKIQAKIKEKEKAEQQKREEQEEKKN